MCPLGAVLPNAQELVSESRGEGNGGRLRVTAWLREGIPEGELGVARRLSPVEKEKALGGARSPYW